MRNLESIVLFDVDNTLIKGFSIFHFADFLQTKGLFPKHIRQIMQDDYDVFTKNDLDYGQFAIQVVDHFYNGLQGISEDLVIARGGDFLQSYRKYLFTYSEQLLTMMDDIGPMVAISGAPKEAFGPLGRSLGMARFYLLEGEVRDGVYTGRTKLNMALDEEKKKVVAALAEEFDFSRSFAFGDSIHDLPLLEAVANPFVVERDPELIEYARTKGWAIVNEHTILDSVRKRLTDLRLF